MRLNSNLIVIVIALCALASGQSQPTQSGNKRPAPAAPALTGIVGQDAQGTDEEDSSALPKIPALLGGPGSFLAFTSEAERSNYLRGGVNVGAAYDDNALLTPSNRVGNTTYSVFPNIALDLKRPRVRWTLGYAGGLTVNQRLSDRNQGAHDLAFDLSYRLSPHVNLRVAENFGLTSGIFDVRGNALQTGPGVPNGNLITPLSRKRTSFTVGEINYHFALNDVVGASGSFYDLHYRDVPPSTVSLSLADTRTTSASAFWFHRLLKRDWLGASYRFQRLRFDPNGETNIHSFDIANTATVGKNLNITAFVGPEYSDNQGLVAGGTGQATQFTKWFLAGGIEVAWQGQHTSVAAGYSRRLNDGGGLLGTVRAQETHVGFRRELLPGWAAGLGVSYGNSESLTVLTAASARAIKAASAGASLERSLGRKFVIRADYIHDFQQQAATTLVPDLNVDRNRVSLTLGYQWTKALGR
jgi:hypothetical protein